jgi:hypothetical protein
LKSHYFLWFLVESNVVNIGVTPNNLEEYCAFDNKEKNEFDG